MSLLIVFAASFCAGFITLVFTFGLGLVLLPIFSIFLPLQQAIVFAAATFFFFNLVRIFLTWRYVDYTVLIKFSLVALIGVLIGGYLLNYALAIFLPKTIKIIMALVLLVMVLFDAFKVPQKLKLPNNYIIIIGAFISGFAGSLAGIPGPFRVATLLNLKLDYKAFVATSTAVALVIDGLRLLVYFFAFFKISGLLDVHLIVSLIGSITAFFLFYRIVNKIKIEKLKPIILSLIIALIIFMIFV